MKIIAIRKTSVTEPHYDITVSGTHTFIANGILTHNCNTSAQNSIIVGVHRGINPVDELDIIQEAGRAGRFGRAPYGNVFLICDSRSEWQQRIKHPKNVESTLLNTHALAFHLCAEIKNGVIRNEETMYAWYAKTLASIQKPLTKQQIDDVLLALQNWRAVHVAENGIFEITALGKIAATLYFHPEDVHHWAICFGHINQNNLWNSDPCLAYALAAPTMQLPYIPRPEVESVNEYMRILRSFWGRGSQLMSSTLARDIHDLLGGSKPTPLVRPLQYDAERISGAITWIAGILRFNRPDLLKVLPLRLRFGVSSDLVQLVQLPGIGAVRARKLASYGITTWHDIISNPAKVQTVVGQKNLKQVIDYARHLIRTNADGN